MLGPRAEAAEKEKADKAAACHEQNPVLTIEREDPMRKQIEIFPHDIHQA
jgi:hypothetical protein